MVTIESREAAKSAPRGGQDTSHARRAPPQTMSRTQSTTGSMSGYSTVRLRIEPRTGIALNMARGNHAVRLSDGQQGLLGKADTRQRQRTCQITKPSAKTLLHESDFNGQSCTGSPVRAGQSVGPRSSRR